MNNIFLQLFSLKKQSKKLEISHQTLYNQDLFAMHFVYIPRMNRALQHFTAQWNNHPVSGEHELLPLQMFTSGILDNMRSSYSGVECSESK